MAAAAERAGVRRCDLRLVNPSLLLLLCAGAERALLLLALGLFSESLHASVNHLSCKS
jgi:hypothetical protein